MSNRYQCVQINNQTSGWLPINTGVPQGSVLGPILFLIYIIDLHLSATDSNVFLFADDTNVACKNLCFDLFQKALTNISKWLSANKLTLNSDKTSLITFDRNSRTSSLQILLDEIMYEPKSSCNYLGVVLVWKLSFVFHIQKIKTKLGRHCGIVLKNAPLCSNVNLTQILPVENQTNNTKRFSCIWGNQFFSLLKQI